MDVSHTSTVPADNSTDDLLRWASQSGLYLPKLQPGTKNGMRGMVATNQVKKGGLLLSVPRAKALIVHDGDPSPFPSLLSDEEWSLASE